MKLIIQLVKALIHDQPARRMAMFVVVVVAMVMLFAGSTFLNGWLSGNPFMFLVYWAACGWLALTAVLLALFDILMVRVQIQREKRRLKEEIFGGKEHD